MTPCRRTLPWIALFAAVTLAAGCGLFSTRSPVSPNQGHPIPTNFSLPESTLATLVRAVHGQSPPVYGQCLADTVGEQRDFHATFDPADLIDFQRTGQTPPADWNKEQELSFIPQFIALFS